MTSKKQVSTSKKLSPAERKLLPERRKRMKKIKGPNATRARKISDRRAAKKMGRDTLKRLVEKGKGK